MTLPELVGKHYVKDGKLFVIRGTQQGITLKGWSYIDMIEVRQKVINDDQTVALGKSRWILWSRDIEQRVTAYEQQCKPEGAA